MSCLERNSASTWSINSTALSFMFAHRPMVLPSSVDKRGASEPATITGWATGSTSCMASSFCRLPNHTRGVTTIREQRVHERSCGAAGNHDQHVVDACRNGDLNLVI